MAESRDRSRPGTVPGQRHGRETSRPGARGTAGGSDSPGQDAGLDCSVSALSGALLRLAAATDPARAAAAAAETVWWATAVDAALTRRHPAAYSRALGALDPAARKELERTFAGFRFVRSQLGPNAGPVDFIQPEPGSTVNRMWSWADFPPPTPQQGAARDMSPYREYRVQLAGKLVEETLRRTSDFLATAHAAAGGAGCGTSAAAS